jgi:membrane-associated phospholipid phosphatase
MASKTVRASSPAREHKLEQSFARELGNDADWVLPAALFVAAQYAVAFPLSAALGFPHLPPIFGYFVLGTVVALAGSVVLLVRALWRLWRVGEERPTRALIQLAREHRRRLLIAALGILLIQLQVGSLTWLKTLLPLVVPFWADPMLANADRFIFGTDPWRLLRPALDPVGPAIAWLYSLWFPLKAILLLALLFALPSRRKSQALLAYFLTIGLFGVVGQYALSSAGPLFYELIGQGSRFAELESHLSPPVRAARDYLWDAYVNGGDKIGGGISAMPSIHVAMTAWLALAMRSLFRPLQWAGWAFFGIVLVGSVYLGWHYAVDSLAGTIAAVLSWQLAAAVIDRAHSWRVRRSELDSGRGIYHEGRTVTAGRQSPH